MAEYVQDATLESLEGIQASISALRHEVRTQFDSFAEEARKDRRNINGLMALLQAASGDFDERIRDIDDCVSVREDKAL